MTGLCAADRDYWPTEEEITTPGFRVLSSISHGDLSAGIYTTGEDSSGFYLTWSDGVANSWREKHSTFHNALARAAMLAYCELSEWDLFSKQQDESEFARVARAFFRDTTQ